MKFFLIRGKGGEMLVGRGGGGGKGNLLRPDTNNVTASFPGMGFSILQKRQYRISSFIWAEGFYTRCFESYLAKFASAILSSLFLHPPEDIARERRGGKGGRNCQEFWRGGGKEKEESLFPSHRYFSADTPTSIFPEKKFFPARLPRLLQWK